MLVEVRIPAGQARFGFGFEEVSVRKGDFALTLAAALSTFAATTSTSRLLRLAVSQIDP